MTSKRPIIILCPARNEEQRLKKLLPAWELFADHIIIADQRSEDGTRAVAERFAKVIVIDNDSAECDEGYRSRLLVDKAREISREGIFIYLDADEIFSANILYSPEWKSFCDQPAGTAGLFEWICLWGSARKYLSMGRYAFAFIDDGRDVRSGSKLHSPRGAGAGPFQRQFFFNEIVNMHLCFINREIGIRKNNWYKVYYIIKGAKSYRHVNVNHNWLYDIKENDLLSVPESWLLDYSRRGIDVTSNVLPDLLWHDVDILRWFAKYGTKKFFFLDIWRGIDWEEKRRLARERGIQGIPDETLRKPSRIVIFLNGLGTHSFSFTGLLVKIKNRILRMLLP